MRQEIELKFELPVRSLAKLKGSNLVTAKGEAARPSKVVSVYFDTDKFALRRKGISLRVRRIDGRRIQTIKADGAAAAGLFNRREWEKEIGGDAPDLTAAQGTALEPLLTKKVKKALRPVFETRVERTVFPLDAGESQVDLVLDRGRIRSGDKTASISEVELELKSGDRSALFSLAEDLTKVAPATLAVRSKAERGYALLEGKTIEAVGGEPVALEPEMTIGEAFRVIGINCLRHVAANETAVAKGDSEGIHQMRVGLRRLRAAISVFGEMLPDPQTGWIKTELKWLASQLAPARDLDVFLSESVEPVRRAQPAKRELHTLRTELEGRRAKAFAAVRQAVQSPRYRTLLLDTLKWLETGDWTRNDDTRSWRERPIKAFARETLARRSAKVVKKAKKVEELDDLARHKLRIAIKKLRYTAEFFAGLFAGRKAEKRSAAFQDALKELQACLGKLNDIAVHEKLAARLIHGETPGGGRRIRNGSAFAVGVVSGRQQSRIAPILRAAAKAASAFARVRAFWKA